MYYCQECRRNYELKDKEEHIYLHCCKDEVNATEGMNAWIIFCSVEQCSRDCKLCEQKLQAGKECIEFDCCGNVIHLKCRQNWKNNFCPYCTCRILFDDIDEELKSNYFLVPNTTQMRSKILR